MKEWYIVLSLLFFIVLIIPSMVVIPFITESTYSDKKHVEPPQEGVTKTESDITVSIYRTGKKEIEKVQLEEYVKGVLASEMPTNFELEALKAQALTARTYIVRKLVFPNEPKSPNGTDVMDSTSNQVYKNESELREKWGKNYESNIKKITQAVNETRGQILTYEGKPIDASFFSTSNGYTENSEDYWSLKLPYLRSVPSPWDQSSPKFMNFKEFSIDSLESKLGVNIPKSGPIGSVKRTSSHRVASIEISGKKFKGKDVRSLLGLNSSDFTFERKGEQVIVITKGNGHGVGMSQYGANGMAEEGKDYKDIVSYYYKDVLIDDISSLQDIEQLIVKNKID